MSVAENTYPSEDARDERNRHRRLLAAGVLCAALLAPPLLLLLVGSEASGRASRGGDSLAQLERRIAEGEADAATWSRYAQALEEAGRYGHAAAAFARVLEREPYQRDLHRRRVMALARHGDADRLYAVLDELVLADAPAALGVLESSELAAYLEQERFTDLLVAARIQAMD